MLNRPSRLDTTAQPRTSSAMTAKVGSLTGHPPPIGADGVRRSPLVEPRVHQPCGLRPMWVSAGSTERRGRSARSARGGLVGARGVARRAVVTHDAFELAWLHVAGAQHRAGTVAVAHRCGPRGGARTAAEGDRRRRVSQLEPVRVPAAIDLEHTFL